MENPASFNEEAGTGTTPGPYVHSDEVTFNCVAIDSNGSRDAVSARRMRVTITGFGLFLR